MITEWTSKTIYKFNFKFDDIFQQKFSFACTGEHAFAPIGSSLFALFFFCVNVSAVALMPSFIKVEKKHRLLFLGKKK